MRTVLAKLLILALLCVGCRQAPASERHESDTYTIEATEIGFIPAKTKIPKGRPVTLIIRRRTDDTCLDEIVFPSLHQRYALRLGEPVKVTLGPQPEGSISYICGKNVYGGEIVVR